MPVLKHAKKKMRQDKKRTLQNKRVKTVFRELLKKAKQQPTKENISAAFSSLDKAAKNNVIHKKKAARMKASLSKFLSPAPSVKAEGKSEITKKTASKSTPKRATKSA